MPVTFFYVTFFMVSFYGVRHPGRGLSMERTACVPARGAERGAGFQLFIRTEKIGVPTSSQISPSPSVHFFSAYRWCHQILHFMGTPKNRRRSREANIHRLSVQAYGLSKRCPAFLLTPEISCTLDLYNYSFPVRTEIFCGRMGEGFAGAAPVLGIFAGG